jgi:hypothetical protein
VQIAQSPDVKEIMDKQGLEAAAGTAADLAKLTRDS